MRARAHSPSTRRRRRRRLCLCTRFTGGCTHSACKTPQIVCHRTIAISVRGAIRQVKMICRFAVCVCVCMASQTLSTLITHITITLNILSLSFIIMMMGYGYCNVNAHSTIPSIHEKSHSDICKCK